MFFLSISFGWCSKISLKIQFLLLIRNPDSGFAAAVVFFYLNNSYITKTHGKVERSISSAIDVIVRGSVV